MTINPDEAARTLWALLNRCDESNSTEGFRETVQHAIDLLNAADFRKAGEVIGWAAANVSGERHECYPNGPCHPTDPTPKEEEVLGKVWADRVRLDNRTAHWLQADEEQTQAYQVLDRLRFGFGWEWARVQPNNIILLGGGG